jgi:hypothetical protein
MCWAQEKPDTARRYVHPSVLQVRDAINKRNETLKLQ